MMVERPRDFTEMLVGEGFERILGRTRYSPDDDFFMLGGTSVGAAILLTELSEKIGTTVPITSFLRDPTVSGMARAVRAAASNTGNEQRVVTVREGTRTPPFFCVHGQSGEVYAFRSVRAHPGHSTVMGIRAVGTDGLLEPLESVPEMAEHYVAAIRERQPRGPYVLGGYCLGAWVAYEVAARLTAEDGPGTVATLLALEPPLTDPLPQDDADALRRGRHPWLQAIIESALPGFRLLESSWDGVVGQLRDAGLAPTDVTGDMTRRRLQVIGRNIVAATRYRPPTTPLDVVLAFSTDITVDLQAETELAFRALGCTTETVALTTGHDHMFECPELAALIDRSTAAAGVLNRTVSEGTR